MPSGGETSYGWIGASIGWIWRSGAGSAAISPPSDPVCVGEGPPGIMATAAASRYALCLHFHRRSHLHRRIHLCLHLINACRLRFLRLRLHCLNHPCLTLQCLRRFLHRCLQICRSPGPRSPDRTQIRFLWRKPDQDGGKQETWWEDHADKTIGG